MNLPIATPEARRQPRPTANPSVVVDHRPSGRVVVSMDLPTFHCLSNLVRLASDHVCIPPGEAQRADRLQRAFVSPFSTAGSEFRV